MGQKEQFKSLLTNGGGGCGGWARGVMRCYQFEFYLREIFIVIFLVGITTTGSFRGKYQNLYLSNRTDLR